MQVGSTVWNGDQAGIVLVNDENGVTVGYFASIETITSDAENPSPLASNPTPNDAPANEPDVVEKPAADEPPPPFVPTANEPADPLAALTEDERATYTRLQGKIDGSGA